MRRESWSMKEVDMGGVLDVNLFLNETTGAYPSQTNSELL